MARLPSRSRPVTARSTNLTLLLALVVVFATGAGALLVGTPAHRWVVIAHGVGGLLVVALVPWKTRVSRRGFGRGGPRRYTRWLSLALAVLAVATLVLGFLHSTGAVVRIGPERTMWWHVAAALALVPLLVWHLLARRTWPLRRDVTRAGVTRLAVLAGAAGVAWLALEGAVRAGGWPGTRRRFTGSYEVASFDPERMPRVIWLDDRSPRIDASLWRLEVVDARGAYELSLADLRRERTTVRAALDCTGGWYSVQDWVGVPLTDLVREVGDARSVTVTSRTGYWRRFAVEDLPGLLLAHEVSGVELPRGLGAPARLVAPGRRGFEWVKWVERVEVDPAPGWWQPTFPLT